MTGALAAVGVALLVAMAVAATARRRGGWRSKRAARPPGKPAAQRSVKQLQRSIRCLINEERAKRDLGRLARTRTFRRWGWRTAKRGRDQLPRAPVRRRGSRDQAARGRLLRRRGMWQFAENTGCALSAEAMAANWMATNFHRVNILERRFHEIGVGAVQGRVKDRCERGCATFAVVLGWRGTGTPRH